MLDDFEVFDAVVVLDELSGALLDRFSDTCASELVWPSSMELVCSDVSASPSDKVEATALEADMSPEETSPGPQLPNSSPTARIAAKIERTDFFT